MYTIEYYLFMIITCSLFICCNFYLTIFCLRTVTILCYSYSVLLILHIFYFTWEGFWFIAAFARSSSPIEYFFIRLSFNPLIEMFYYDFLLVKYKPWTLNLLLPSNICRIPRSKYLVWYASYKLQHRGCHLKAYVTVISWRKNRWNRCNKSDGYTYCAI